MTETALFSDQSLKDNTIATWRYYAFLELERRTLRFELDPNWKDDKPFMVPCDRHVNRLCLDGGSPLERAQPVLELLGLPPFEHEAWVDFLGIDISAIPIIGSVK